ncbi:type VI secretion system Vgr family protein [Paraburkholderia silviterrae]|uniref:Type VI secretion system tip protein VgrG n=1 Tax=Paraburkholderia silviterrae TaxID=2528715 RepID=A0A4R5LXY1_9BURK|nr:type VI secretion system Vgr family protein [Paraburkholderia silviterrae]TDG16948.1 type VI secretion system tip protein VgrG [Paraburkholderia silviterrae]
MSVNAQYTSLFGAFNRRYSLEGAGPLSAMQIERWSGHEGLCDNYRWDIYALATSPALDLEAMLGQRATIRTALGDGTSATRSGLVAEAECVGYDAGLARYHLQLVPWLAALTHGRDERTFVNRSVAEILEQVFADYGAIARWRFTTDANQRIEALGASEYVVQYRSHSHYDFVRHLLAAAGLGFCFVEEADAPSGHTLLIFDDSTQLPEDDTSARLGGVPQRRSDMTTAADDMILGMGQSLSLTADRLTLISSDYRSNQSTTAAASIGRPGGSRELYDDVGPQAFTSLREAENTARRQAEAIVSAARFWTGYSTLRTATSGRALRPTHALWAQVGGGTQVPDAFLLSAVQHVGVNDLPQTVMAAVEQTLGGLPGADLDPRVLKQAQSGGYANRFEAVPRSQAWRPTLEDGTGARLNPVATALGAQTAIVVGPQGESSPGAAGPVHMDGQGRLRVRFHWQAENDNGTWPTRTMQRLASDGHGLQQMQRIGQEVLVQFDHGLIDRPIILGGLFNGRGEGGEAPTPGGEPGKPLDESIYRQATDQMASAQGNLAGGNAPAWHGAGGGANRHNHAGALSGFKSQGFDGESSNQLVADDSDGMGRLQMSTTHAATQLNLGHLRYQADNYLGSFRGQGVELRSDAYGAVRGERGVLISSYASGASQPAGNVPAMRSLLAQHIALARQLDKSAETHLTLPLASQRGVTSAGQSMINRQAAPLEALAQSFGTTVSADGFQQGLADAPKRATDKPLPHTGDAVLGIEARGGQGLLAGQALQWTAGETLSVGSGRDLNLAVNQALRVHSGQGIGWLAGGNASNGGGLTVIAGKDNLELQAQHDALALRARDELRVASIGANVELAAQKTVHLAVSGGAHLTIEGGNVTFGCPGAFVVHAAAHSFDGPDQLDTQMPYFPEKVCVECLLHAMQSGSALAAKAA